MTLLCCKVDAGNKSTLASHCQADNTDISCSVRDAIVWELLMSAWLVMPIIPTTFQSGIWDASHRLGPAEVSLILFLAFTLTQGQESWCFFLPFIISK